MKNLFLCFFVFLIGCANTGTITSGQLIVNGVTKIDLLGKEIVLNKDCSPQKINFDIPFCGGWNLNEEELCTLYPKDAGTIYKIFQVINDNDALLCTLDYYGGCDKVIYVKNLGKGVNNLIDDALIPNGLLVKKKPYRYTTVIGGSKTIEGYEFVVKGKFSKIKYQPNDIQTCPFEDVTYSSENNKDWIKDKK